MGDSLYLPSNVQLEWLNQLDAVLVAKVMYDRGYPLPADWRFAPEDEIPLLFHAIGYLFDAELIDVSGDDFEITFPDRLNWLRLQEQFPEMADDEEWILSPVAEISSPCNFGVIECEFTDYGFVIHADGGYGPDYFRVVKDFIEFKERFFYKLNLWRERHASTGDIEAGRSINSVA